MFWRNAKLALEGVLSNRLRAMLTALGILFGVAAVITMLAIGNGAKIAILEQLRLVGTNNIVIEARVPGSEGEQGEAGSEETESNSTEDKNPFSPGLRISDLNAIERIVPTVQQASPELTFERAIMVQGKQMNSRCIGVRNGFFHLNNLGLDRGRWFQSHELKEGTPVCIIGDEIRTRLFGGMDPIGKKIKCGFYWYTVIGTLERRRASSKSLETLGIRDYNADVYIPLQAAITRFEDRTKINGDDFRRNQENNRIENYHQIDRAVIQVNQAEMLRASANVISRILKRRHNDQVDYFISIPELLVEQQQRTQETLNFVLAVIAGISLLVGGIGIMNIMLASVMERIKEIGIRRSIGATRSDVIWQFLLEAIFIGLIGGIAGIILGIVSAHFISNYADIPTVLTPFSIIISFGVSVMIGLTFGYLPARKAARQDPITALRTE